MSLSHLRYLHYFEKVILMPIKRKFVTDVSKISDTSKIVPPASTLPTPDQANVKPQPEAQILPPPTNEKPIEFIVNPPDTFIKLDHLELAPESEAMRKSLSFDEIPGPLSFKYMSKFWNLIPALGTQMTAGTIQFLLNPGKIFGNSLFSLGEQFAILNKIFVGTQLSWGRNFWLFRRMFDGYGPVIRLHGPFGGDVLVLCRPEHANVIFQSDGQYPIRSCLDCIEKYRLNYRKYKNVGPFLMHGPEWEILRKAIEQPLKICTNYQFEQISKSCDELITRIVRIRNRQEEVPNTFKNELFKWSLECLCSMTLNKRLGFLDPAGLTASSEPAKILEGLNGATDAIRRCEHGFKLWKFMETPAWRALTKNCDLLDTTLNKYINKAQDGLLLKEKDGFDVTPESVSFLETLLLKEGMLSEDALTILLDMFLIGVNATSHSVAFLLYHLARNPRVQRKLYNEVKDVAWNVKKEDIPNMPYLQACIKESLRLKAPMPILTRVLLKDTLVHNYRIPKGTSVLIATYYTNLREDYFEEAHRFKPERWLEDDYTIDYSNIPAAIPFGYGPKSCLARELAEMQITLFAIKILSRFRVEYYYGEIKSTNSLLASPDRPLKFRFIDRV